jgi:hypothetical protein
LVRCSSQRQSWVAAVISDCQLPVERHLLRQKQVEQHHQTDPQRSFQMHANHRQPSRRTGVALQQHVQTLLPCFATQAFELYHRQQKAATQAKPPPRQTGQQLRLEQSRPLVKGLLSVGVSPNMALDRMYNGRRS